MKNNKKALIYIFSFILIAASCVLLAKALKPAEPKQSAYDHMQLSDEERIGLAKPRYVEFEQQQKKQFEVMLSLSPMTKKDFIDLFSEPVGFCAAFYSGKDSLATFTTTNRYASTAEFVSDMFGMQTFPNETDSNTASIPSTSSAPDSILIHGLHAHISGERLISLASSEKVRLIEILDFDDNDHITPLMPQY